MSVVSIAADREVVARVDASIMVFKSATLYDNGDFEIIPTKSDELIRTDVGRFTFSKLLHLAQKTSGAALTTVTKTIICMTFVAVPHSTLYLTTYDRSTGHFGGLLNLTLTSRGCYLKTEVFPVLPDQLKAAESLKNMIELLAIDRVEHSESAIEDPEAD